MPDDREQREKRDAMQQIARYSEMGFIIPAGIIAGLIVGKLLDYTFHTHWIYIAGLIVGAVVGFVQMVRIAIQSSADPK